MTKSLNTFFDYNFLINNLYDDSYMRSLLAELANREIIRIDRITSTFVYAYDSVNEKYIRFRYMRRIHPIKLVKANTLIIKKDALEVVLNSIERELFITVNNIVFCNDEEELAAYCKKHQFNASVCEQYKEKRGMYDALTSDVVINVPKIWSFLPEIPTYNEEHKNYFFVCVLVDVLLHELRHAWQYNPLFYKWSIDLLKSESLLEDDATNYVAKHHERVMHTLLG